MPQVSQRSTPAGAQEHRSLNRVQALALGSADEVRPRARVVVGQIVVSLVSIEHSPAEVDQRAIAQALSNEPENPGRCPTGLRGQHGHGPVDRPRAAPIWP
jgi:hypothetical protein